MNLRKNIKNIISFICIGNKTVNAKAMSDKTVAAKLFVYGLEKNGVLIPTCGFGDYFHYVMFSWGNCQAGDRLVMERKLKRSPTPEEMGVGFTPGVRFYFRYKDLEKHPQKIHDGFLPIKVKTR